MQDKIILGMLSLKSMSVYELKKNMEKSTRMFYNTSIGSIHPACQKLLKQGFVTCTEEMAGKRAKKVFAITENGRQDYIDWLKSPLGIGKIKDELLLRLFFFSDAGDAWREVVENYLVEVKQISANLEQTKAGIDLSTIPAEFQRPAQFQTATLDLGCAYYRFLQTWLEEFLAKDL
ncbi:MAG: PadR family transcriptional regulator [Gammaproteobacteria bacterium]|nr:PadR family transcriptional regulator [Gammaproteobacteria bacterium]MDH5730424.1 PadR family transcriptional regulator [Gammaproteobacteria bacterium]